MAKSVYEELTLEQRLEAMERRLDVLIAGDPQVLRGLETRQAELEAEIRLGNAGAEAGLADIQKQIREFKDARKDRKTQRDQILADVRAEAADEKKKD